MERMGMGAGGEFNPHFDEIHSAVAAQQAAAAQLADPRYGARPDGRGAAVAADARAANMHYYGSAAGGEEAAYAGAGLLAEHTIPFGGDNSVAAERMSCGTFVGYLAGSVLLLIGFGRHIGVFLFDGIRPYRSR